MKYLSLVLFVISSFILHSETLPLVTNSSCSLANGSIRLFPETSTTWDPASFVFSWHVGDESGPVLPASATNPALLENLPPGTYTVVAKIVEPMDLRHLESTNGGQNIGSGLTGNNAYVDDDNLMSYCDKSKLCMFQYY